MIVINLPADDGDRHSGFSGLGKRLGAAGKELKTRYPAYELWEIESLSTARCYYNVRRPGRRMRHVIAVGQDAAKMRPGDVVQVGYYQRQGRQYRAYILCKVGVADWSIPAPVLPGIRWGLWVCPEGSVWLPQASATAQPQLLLSGAGNSEYLAGLSRNEDSSGESYDSWYTDFNGLLLYALGPSDAPTDTILAAMRTVWTSLGSGVAWQVRILEYSLSGSLPREIVVPISVSSIRPADLSNATIYLPNRQQGYFFIDQISDDDVVYTVALDSGIVSLRRSDVDLQTTSNWVADPRRYNGRAGNIAVAGSWLLECGYSALAINPDTGSYEDGGAQLQLYRREGLAWIPSHLVRLADVLPTSITTGYSDGSRGIFPVGILRAEAETEDGWPEGNWAYDLPSTRWPFFAHQARREFWLWANALDVGLPRFFTLSIDAESGQAAIVDDFAPDLSSPPLLFPDLVSQFESGLSLEGCHVVEPAGDGEGWSPGSFPCGVNGIPGTPSFATVGQFPITVETDPGDPEADPPIPATTQTVYAPILGGSTGRTYTGFAIGSVDPSVLPEPWEGNRFFAHPLLGEQLVNAIGTSAQAPSGVISSAGLYFSVCSEPVPYASSAHLVDNVPQDARSWDDPEAYESWRAITDSEWLGASYPAAENYCWVLKNFPRTIDNGGDGHGMPPVVVEPPIIGFGPAGYINPDESEEFWSYGIWSEGMGNTFTIINPIKYQFFKTKVHGVFDYSIWHRTWINVIDAKSKALKFRTDISQYLTDGPRGVHSSRNATPQLLSVFSILPAGDDYLWVLRDLHWDVTPDEDGIQTHTPPEPHLQLYRVGASALELLSTVNLHPEVDLPERALSPALDRLPHMLVGATSAGHPYAACWTNWSGGRLVSEVIYNGSTTVKTEAWNADAPLLEEARNAIHHDGALYWHRLPADLLKKPS